MVSIDFSTLEFCSGVALAVYTNVMPSWYFCALVASSSVLFSPALSQRRTLTGMPMAFQWLSRRHTSVGNSDFLLINNVVEYFVNSSVI